MIMALEYWCADKIAVASTSPWEARPYYDPSADHHSLIQLAKHAYYKRFGHIDKTRVEGAWFTQYVIQWPNEI